MPEFEPTDISSTAPRLFHTTTPTGSLDGYKNESQRRTWAPIYSKPCSFPADVFQETMMEMVRNPNHNSSWILRADVLFDSDSPADTKSETVSDAPVKTSDRLNVSREKESPRPRSLHIPDFTTTRVLVRKFIPRNPLRDNFATQTCVFLETASSPHAEKSTLVIYLTHSTSTSDTPYYLPAAEGLAFLHEPSKDSENPYTLTLHYLYFPSQPPSALPLDLRNRLQRTALHLLARIHKLGNGILAGYQKRVQHDVVISKERFQDTYLRLRLSHASRLMERWVEKTDPRKHVFEDILIAAFLIEFWRDRYGVAPREERKSGNSSFPGFVDIGCGNGVLVDILLREGYDGYGIDARKRKTWGILGEETGKRLFEKVLIPSIISGTSASPEEEEEGIHNGVFPPGTFLISNHADELTGWTPILAKLSNSDFIIIPCCSHNLSGAKFRAPSSGGSGGQQSTYSALVDWVEGIAVALGCQVAKEVLRIPSTRNVAIVGRGWGDGESVESVLEREGGSAGWRERSEALKKV
ncbi:tRNA(Ser) Um(44) 2'-O-methyltransferase [Rhizina undulata]